MQVAVDIAVLGAEAAFVAEDFFVDQRGQAVKLHQGVLQRRGGEQQFFSASQRTLEALPGGVALAVGVAQLVRFVDDCRVPRNIADGLFHSGGEMVGADADHIAVERGVSAA